MKFRVIVKSLILEKGCAGIPVRWVYLKLDLLYAPLETKSASQKNHVFEGSNRLINSILHMYDMSNNVSLNMSLRTRA